MKQRDLEKDNINKLLISFAIPCIISMLINSIYNIVDQIFIGQGVGYLGNAATNVIFPIVIICTGLAGLIGNGLAANLSLRLGEKNVEEAKRSIGAGVILLIIVSLIVCLLGEIFLPNLIQFFGCTANVYDYAMSYGRVILIGAPFMIIYSGLASFIRADGSPKYSMVCLLSGAIINIILDPVFIFGFDMGVVGGALATVIGQIASCIIAIAYLWKIKSVKMTKKDYRLNNSLKRTLSYGIASFIIQMTVLALFIVMNNVMTKYGATTKFGSDIPLSVYGVISKLINVYVSVILGLACGAQPIIGFNYGAGNTKRVKEIIKKVLKVGLIIGIIFNIGFVFFPKTLVSLFGSSDNALYMEFAVDCCRIFLLVSALNFLEMCSSIIIQSLGNAKKSTAVSFIRQIILFIPLCLILVNIFGLYGALYAAPIADAITFIIVIFILKSEYNKLNKEQIKEQTESKEVQIPSSLKNKIIITINREYGSGGRYIGKLLGDELGIKCYDKDLIDLVAKDSNLSVEYIMNHDQIKNNYTNLNNSYNLDDELFISENRIIKELAKKDSCIIVGRCSDYILKNEKNVLKVFIYADLTSKINRAVKYYGLKKKEAQKTIEKINKARRKHYKYYTNQEWDNPNHYDICLNSNIGIENCVKILKELIKNKDN